MNHAGNLAHSRLLVDREFWQVGDVFYFQPVANFVSSGIVLIKSDVVDWNLGLYSFERDSSDVRKYLRIFGPDNIDVSKTIASPEFNSNEVQVEEISDRRRLQSAMRFETPRKVQEARSGAVHQEDRRPPPLRPRPA